MTNPKVYFVVLRNTQAGMQGTPWGDKIATVAGNEELSFGGRHELNIEIEDKLYAYYLAANLDAPNPKA